MSQTTSPRAAAATPPELDDADVRDRLLGELDEQSAALAAARIAVDSLADQTDLDSSAERELAESAAMRTLEAVAEVEAALQRLDGGAYGLCEECGRPIAPERLEAIPHARWCISCQTVSGR
jgi:RNA polymerase-binding transcription factor DksA